MKIATLRELSEALAEFVEKYPELADRHVYMTAECGYSGAYVASPISLYTNPRIKSEVYISSDDDWVGDDYTIYKRSDSDAKKLL